LFPCIMMLLREFSQYSKPSYLQGCLSSFGESFLFLTTFSFLMSLLRVTENPSSKCQRGTPRNSISDLHPSRCLSLSGYLSRTHQTDSPPRPCFLFFVSYGSLPLESFSFLSVARQFWLNKGYYPVAGVVFVYADLKFSLKPIDGPSTPQFSSNSSVSFTPQPLFHPELDILFPFLRLLVGKVGFRYTYLSTIVFLAQFPL